MKRLLTFVVALAAVMALTQSTASAQWATPSTGSGQSRARHIGVPTSVTATAVSSSAVDISWSPPANGVTPTAYEVRRINPSGIVCTLAAAPLTCRDIGLDPSTTYSYVVDARIGDNWIRSSATEVVTTN